MKCLTVYQPFASLLVGGVKRYETRGFQTKHRGLLAVSSSAKFPAELKSLCYTPRVAALLMHVGIQGHELLPCGMLLGGVEVVDCCEGEVLLASGKADLGEQAVGDFAGPKRWGWKCERPWQLPVPMKVRGQLGVWELPSELAQLVENVRGAIIR